MAHVALQNFRPACEQPIREMKQDTVQLGKRSHDQTDQQNRNVAPANTNIEENSANSIYPRHRLPFSSKSSISQSQIKDECIPAVDSEPLVIEEQDNTESLESTTCSRSNSNTNCGKLDYESIMTDKSCENRIDITIGISTVPKNGTDDINFTISQNKHNHLSKTVEQRSFYSTPNECRNLISLKLEEIMFLERVAMAPKSTETYLQLISSDRTKLQKLMKICNPTACPKREEVRLFASTQKKVVALLKTENQLIFLRGLDKAGFSAKLSSNCIQYSLKKPERVNQISIVDKECDIDPLVEDFIYCGVLFDDLSFQELLFDCRFSNKGTCLRKVTFRFAEPESRNIIGLEYSPYIKCHDNLPQYARVVLMRDEPEQVRINALIVERSIPEFQSETEVTNSESLVCQHFLIPKQKYRIEGKVFSYNYRDPYNRPILMLIPKLLTSILVIELSSTTEKFTAKLCKVAISGAKRGIQNNHEAGPISEEAEAGTPSQVDWVIPPSQAVLKGIVTLLCDGFKYTVHIRRINPQSNPDDYLPPTRRHLDDLLDN